MSEKVKRIPEEVVRMGRAVRLERHRQQLTQQDLADRIGCSAGHVSRFELGQIVMSLPNLCKFAEVLGVSLEYLVCPMEDPVREGLREPWPERALLQPPPVLGSLP